MALKLREYQEEALEALRYGVSQGYKAQILYAPTGAGKTEMAIALLEAAKQKNNRAAMILDRIILCDQTSARLDRYDIDHGVLQSGHWRNRPYENIQVCSAQTLERREEFPGLSMLIVDEAHQTREATVDFIKKNPDILVIGLTATPFTKGLGRTYKNVISTVTTKQLVDSKVLVPLRVYIAKEIDMTGAKLVAGEWSQKESQERGMKITGDIVQSWIEKTTEIFGGPRKTIVFCSGVNHGNDLSRKFAEHGYNFVSISYRDDDQFKTDVIEDFAKPDTEIHGLIATDILTKGFDVPDVMIGVSARPFSKSLSSHIQQMGRVMRGFEGKESAIWLCLAKGSRVLTDKGLVAIDKVTLDHKIWDGTNFVNHGGAVCNGIQKTITYQGLTATAGHLVHTAEGWRTFGECASKQIRITQTGLGGHPIRIGEDIRPASFLAGSAAAKVYSRSMRMCAMWLQKFDFTIKSSIWKNQRLQALQQPGSRISNVALQPSSSYASAMLLDLVRSISGLWWARSGVQIFRSKTRNALDYGKSWAANIFKCFRAVTYAIRSNRSEWSLRTGQFALAFSGAESAKQTGQSISGKDAQVQDGLSGSSIFRQYVEAFLLVWNDSGANRRAVQQAFDETEREVWDILDAGQHNRFTCEGLLVHNCHSGNYLRFQEDWDDVYANGVHELDDGREKAKKEKSEKEKKEAKCPVCSAYFPAYMDMCGGCGHVRDRKSKLEAVAGKLEELLGLPKQQGESKQDWWSMCQYKMITGGWSQGRAAHVYKDKFGVWPRGLQDVPKLPSKEFEKAVKAGLIRYIKGKGKA